MNAMDMDEFKALLVPIEEDVMDLQQMAKANASEVNKNSVNWQWN